MVQKDIVWWNQSHLGAMIVTSPAFTSCQPMCCWRCGNNYISHPSGCNVPGGKWELVLGLCEKCSAQDGSYREYAFPLGNRVERSKNPSSEPWQDPWRSLCWAESGDWLDRASRFLVMLEQLLCRFQIVSKSLESKTPPIWVFSLVIAIEGFCIRIPPTYIERTMTNDCVKYQIRNHLNTEITKCSSMWLQRQISLLGLIIRAEPNNPVRQLLFEKGTLIPRLEFRKRPVKPRQQWLSTTYADGWWWMPILNSQSTTLIWHAQPCA